MKTFRCCVLLFFSVMLLGCNTSDVAQENARLTQELSALTSERDSLAERVSELGKELSALRSELDEIKHGAGRLLSDGERHLSDKNISDAEKAFSYILGKHPTSKEADVARAHLKKISEDRERQEREKAERINNSLDFMRVTTDKVEGITWYTPKKALGGYGETLSPLILYVGKKSEPWLRMKLFYKSDNWLFVDKAIAYIDGVKHAISGDMFERDHTGGTIWEVSDVSPTSVDLYVLREIIKSKETIIRFYGKQYHNDRKMTPAFKKALQEALDAYEVLGGSMERYQ
ncbi:hypothetical protein [Nitratidesulfovibrio sp. 1201_IL3209]|uniref:hypothetical protein n=1 Tax=Nitratidesulfovibrio sp. 1201_IL3209 TaxID=3084053 RepID=UPI002FDB6E93